MVQTMTLLLVLGVVGQAQGQDPNNLMFVFAALEDGRKLLASPDEFVQALSPFDRAARLKRREKDVSQGEYLAFVGHSVLGWTDSEKQRIGLTLDIVKRGLGRFPLPFPKTVYLIKTTGEEEGNAAYTRDNAIVLPRSNTRPGGQLGPRLLYHELFHVLCRANPRLRERLYKAIGFSQCGEVVFPETLKSRKITNPDGPRNDHCIAVEVDGQPVWAVPILYAQPERYDPNRGGEFFNYMQFRFMVVPRDSNVPPARMPPSGLEPRLVEQNQLSGYFEQIGRNTQYTIHPDEILADNFTCLMMRDPGVQSPEILSKMEAILFEGPSREAGSDQK